MSLYPKENISRLRVRYSETDAMGWVYYACYLHYFEVARSDLIRVLWKSYRRIEDEEGLKLPVIEAGCKYKSGARYEDELDVKATLTLDGKIRLHFEYDVRLADSQIIVATGFTVHCFIDENGKPKRPPDSFINFLVS